MSAVPVEVWGEGEPVILIHGSGAPAPVSAIWSRQRPLAERYRLIIPTRRGYGERPVTMQTDIEGDVADLLSLLDGGAVEREVRATNGSESAGTRFWTARGEAESADAQRPQAVQAEGPQAPAAAGAVIASFRHFSLI